MLLAGIAVFGYYFFGSGKSEYVTFINPAGKIEMLKLSDGSRVWLNASGTVRYASDFATNRKIILEGEAYFEVVHDPSHPFEVETGRLTTKVLGTEFNVRSYKEDSIASITLLKGSVSIAKDHNGIATLEPLFQLNYNKQTDKTIIKPADTSSAVAWRQGRLQFAGASLGDIAATLERWYGVTVRFGNEDMRRCRYFMAFDNSTDLEKLLSAMSAITDMQYSIDKTNKTVTISGQGCR